MEEWKKKLFLQSYYRFVGGFYDNLWYRSPAYRYRLWEKDEDSVDVGLTFVDCLFIKLYILNS